MVATHEILLKAMDSFGVDLKDFDNNFDTRFLLQKYTYIMQAVLNFHAGNYNLYLRGPYSPEVANMGFFMSSNHDEVKKCISNVRFSKNTEALIKNINDIFSSTPGLDTIEALEAWTTYHYIRSTFFPKPDFRNTLTLLFDLKPSMTGKKNDITNLIKKVDKGLKISYA